MGQGPGGSVAAAAIVRDHRTAIEYDLLTLTGYNLDDLGAALPWTALYSFILHLPPASAYIRETHPDEAAWVLGWKNATILADLWDLTAACHTKKGIQPPEYPRPGAKNEYKRRFGADPIPISDFDAWWNS